MSDIKFYEKLSQEIEDSPKYVRLKEVLREKSREIEGTIYVLQSPLHNIEEEITTETKANSVNSFVILIPQRKIIFTSIDEIITEEFEDYRDEFIDSITTLIGVYGFKGKIGNSRKWTHLIEDLEITSITSSKIDDAEVVDQKSKNILELLISLISGSINTPDKGGQANSLLDAVRKRIVQFDGDQTRFIYNDIDKRKISIQGLAGTGKTELLFHRLVNLYNQTDKKIVFTCNSKILANDIKKRLPRFFDQMKVSKREDIDERIKVMRSWGSKYDPESGLYSYICHFYGLDFINYGESGRKGFDGVCERAVQELQILKESSSFESCFDYILIDEAQDFSDSFFKLCDLVVSKQVIIAGDIFQKIYDKKSAIVEHPDFTLNKVYRTDPKNFMFSQFLGFGLKERPVINWLEDESWEVSGYTFEKQLIDKSNSFMYHFSREPINRFHDFQNSSILPTDFRIRKNDDEILDEIRNILNKIERDHPDVTPADIGIVFVSKSKRGYKLADMICSMIEKNYEWETQKIYESQYRSRRSDKVFISNQNNVKGLEFSFLIGILLDEITTNIEIRNTIYMLMTRSFLTSYLIVDEVNRAIFDNYKPLLDEIIQTGYAKIIEPKENEKLKEDTLQSMIEASLTFEQKIEKALRNKDMLNTVNSQKLKGVIKAFGGHAGIEVSEIENIIEINRKYLDE